jgi:hypothetical protein
VTLLAIIYLASLGAVASYAVRSPHLPLRATLLAVFLLVWADLILTAQILSLFTALDVTSAYVALSLGIAVLFILALRRIPVDAPIVVTEFASSLDPRRASWLVFFFVVSGAVVLLANLVMAYGMLPTNPDSAVYRFPRVYWYFGAGSLNHFSNVVDPRAVFYPFNGTLAYLPLVHFRLGPRAFSILSLLSWAATGLTTYLFARNLGGPRLAAVATAWVVCLSPNVLVQALSTNDEIVAATPLLIGVFFLHRWYLGRQRLDAVIGAIGVGISAGTKLHISFYWPLLILIGTALLIHYRAVLQEGRAWLNIKGGAVVLFTSIVVAVLAFSFMAYNYRATGKLMAWDLSAQLLNAPFSLRTGLQTIGVYISQTVLSPVADLHLATDSSLRARYYAAFNEIFAPLFKWVDNGPQFVSVGYRFVGPVSTEAVAFNEQTLFIGFTWLLALIAGLRLLRRWNGGDLTWGRFHLASLPVWFLSFAASTRYIEGFTVYLGYATIVAGPAMIYAFAPMRGAKLNRARWAAVALIVATHCFFAASVLLTSSPRNLQVLARAEALPLSRGFTVDASVQAEIARASRGVTQHSFEWGEPYWPLMAHHPRIRQFLAANPQKGSKAPDDNPADTDAAALRYSRYALMPPPGDPSLHVYPIRQWPAWGYAVLRIPDKATPGLTLVGSVMFALGPEWLFAAGNGVEARHPGRDKYVGFHFYEVSNFGHDPKPVLQITQIVFGLGPEDRLGFRYELRIDGKLVDKTDWQGQPVAQLSTAGLSANNGVLTIFVRNDNAGGRVWSTDVRLRAMKPPDMPGEAK